MLACMHARLSGTSPDVPHAVVFEAGLGFPWGRSLVHAQDEARALVGLLLRIVPLLRPIPVDVGGLHPVQLINILYQCLWLHAATLIR